ncbi:MAG: glycosyltransferase family 39 protein [Chloroflexota bacterium]|jgi:hypothetical protein
MSIRLDRRRLPLVLIVVMVLVIGLPSLFYPFGRDQGIHAYVAASWLDGQMPYKDVWVQKGPLAFVPHLLSIAVFGRTEWAIRVLDLAWQIVSGWLIYRIARRRLSTSGSLLAVFFYLLLYFTIDFWNTSHAEGFLLPFLLLGLDLYDRARLLPISSRQRALIFFSGLAASVTPWFKQTSLVFIAAIFLWMTADLLCDERRSLRLWLERTALFGAGVLAFSLLMILFLAVQGMLAPMVDVLRYSIGAYPNYSPLTEIGDLWQATFDWARLRGGLILLFLAGLGIVLLRRDRRQKWLGIVLLAGAGLVGIYAQRRLWDYHWISTLPFMAMIAAAATITVIDWLVNRKNRWVKWLLAAGLLILITASSGPLFRTYAENYGRLSGYLFGGLDRDRYLEEIGMALEARAADYLDQRVAQDDPIFIWGHYALIYYLTGRHNPTRFAMDPPLSLEHPQQKAWQKEALSDLEDDPPSYILVATGDITPFEPQPSSRQLPQFPGLAAFIDDNYYLSETLDGFDVYVRREPPEQIVNARLGDDIRLVGFDADLLDVKPEGEISITLQWQADRTPEANYTVFVHLIDWSGPRVVAQSDSYPAQGRRPTSTWQPGETIFDTHTFTLPGDLPPGQYELITGMYLLETLERLPVSEGDRDYIPLLQLSATRPDP